MHQKFSEAASLICADFCNSFALLLKVWEEMRANGSHAVLNKARQAATRICNSWRCPRGQDQCRIQNQFNWDSNRLSSSNSHERRGYASHLYILINSFRHLLLNVSDWKCQMRIYDQSVEDEPEGSILLNIFWPQNDMPDASCGDVIIVFSVKVSLTLTMYNAHPRNQSLGSTL